MLQPVSYDRTKTNADRYQHSDYFGEMGFNPFSDNEERYGNRQTNWNKLGNAFGGSWQLIKNQFVEQLSSWGDTFSFFGDKKAAFEQADFDEINKQQKDLFNNHPIYETAEQRDGIWNFNTIANTIQQSGYAVGAVAEIAAEEVVLSLLTAATFGGTSEIQAARSLKLASSIGRVLRKTERLGESLNTANKFRKMYEGFKTINPVGNTVEYLASLKAIRRANEIGYGASKLGTLRTISKGVGALYRDVRVFNAAISEAKAEAAFTYQNLKDTLTERYKNEHGGNEPSGQDVQDIHDAAMGAAQTNGVANTYLIMFSNQLFEGNVMKGFSGLSRMEESASRGILRLGDKTAEKMGIKFVNAAENKWL
jgi:hypothetical protein